MLLAKAHMALHSNLSPPLLLGYLGGLVRFLWHNNIVFIKFSVELESLMASAFTGARGLPPQQFVSNKDFGEKSECRWPIKRDEEKSKGLPGQTDHISMRTVLQIGRHTRQRCST